MLSRLRSPLSLSHLLTVCLTTACLVPAAITFAAEATPKPEQKTKGPEDPPNPPAVPHSTTWQHEELRRFPAAEANQGVAVDDTHAYVISNSAIGKYRKDTFEKVAEWKQAKGGPLIHLNAGIVHNGKLYGAHSNFPGIPMTSSIEVWDTATMQHVDSHSLGIDMGSLTWIEPQKDGTWLACFAHYSKDKPRTGRDPSWTEVVKFDSEWRRTGGWVFPAALTNHFGGSSCSGGAHGPEDLLYVTGHTWRELYVLKFPTAGSVLEWVDTIPISAEGQSFNWDPKEPGIFYGIIKRTKEVVISRISKRTPPSTSDTNANANAEAKQEDTNANSPSTLSEEEQRLGFTSIFDGTSSEGWEHKGNWVIDEDGAFHRKAKGGDLTYKKALVPDDFELRFEWKVSKGCNSGIYYRPSQYEYQVLDNVNSPYGENPRQAAASLFFCMAPSKDATRPLGEWNTARILCKGNVIQHWLNEEKVLDFDYTDPKWAKEVELLRIRGADLSKRGANLKLQDHGQDVWFRNLRWRTIPAEENVTASADFTPMPIPPAALEKENARVEQMLKSKKK
jgi:hypothetical protein